MHTFNPSTKEVDARNQSGLHREFQTIQEHSDTLSPKQKPRPNPTPPTGKYNPASIQDSDRADLERQLRGYSACPASVRPRVWSPEPKQSWTVPTAFYTL